MRNLFHVRSARTAVNPSSPRYSILVDEAAFMAGHILCECYGVRVDTDTESAEMRYITTSQSSITGLVAALQRGMVKPPGLRRAVERWLTS